MLAYSFSLQSTTTHFYSWCPLKVSSLFSKYCRRYVFNIISESFLSHAPPIRNLRDIGTSKYLVFNLLCCVQLKHLEVCQLFQMSAQQVGGPPRWGMVLIVYMKRFVVIGLAETVHFIGLHNFLHPLDNYTLL